MLTFTRIDRLDEAERYWRMLSPRETISDLWDVRFSFYRFFAYPIAFIVGFEKGEPVGLLPLQYNTEKKVFEFFGGPFLDDNRVFIRHGFEASIAQFFEQVPAPAHLVELIGDDAYTTTLPLSEYKYVLPLNGLASFDDYLETYRTASKKKLRRIMRQFDGAVEVVHNHFDDFETLVDLNLKKFGSESSFLLPHRKEIFEDLLKQDLDWQTVRISMNGVKEAVSLGVLYNNTYVSLASGVNTETYPDLRTYLQAQNMNRAISLGAKLYDVGVNDCGWKEAWRFHKIPERLFVVPATNHEQEGNATNP